MKEIWNSKIESLSTLLTLWIGETSQFQIIVFHITCKSFLKSFFPNDSSPQFPFFKYIWKVSIPRKVQSFAVLVLGEMLTHDVLQKFFPDIFLSLNWRASYRNHSKGLDHNLLHYTFSLRLSHKVLG